MPALKAVAAVLAPAPVMMACTCAGAPGAVQATERDRGHQEDEPGGHELRPGERRGRCRLRWRFRNRRGVCLAGRAAGFCQLMCNSAGFAADKCADGPVLARRRVKDQSDCIDVLGSTPCCTLLCGRVAGVVAGTEQSSSRSCQPGGGHGRQTGNRCPPALTPASPLWRGVACRPRRTRLCTRLRR